MTVNTAWVASPDGEAGAFVRDRVQAVAEANTSRASRFAQNDFIDIEFLLFLFLRVPRSS
jgi:hypothetical protein